jgi:hypothetical protein
VQRLETYTSGSGDRYPQKTRNTLSPTGEKFDVPDLPDTIWIGLKGPQNLGVLSRDETEIDRRMTGERNRESCEYGVYNK